ncbi:MAG TPA: VWA domain-containing protein [bacterium]|nr:VWA domain-containing protein [bacterium]HPS28956.1 VWA domain-containing protein [bacterium]
MKKYFAALNILALVAVTNCTPPKQDRTAENEVQKEEIPLIEEIVPQKKEHEKKEEGRVGDKKSRVANSGKISGSVRGIDQFGNGGILVKGFGTGGGGNALGIGGLGTRGRGIAGGSSAYGQIVLHGAVASMPAVNTEQYESTEENGWESAKSDPLSTFSSDVDTASYSNVRRFITNHSLPPSDAVRIEEMINYFSYSYPEPDNSDPVKISTELTGCPWDNAHKIMKIGIKGKNIDMKNAAAGNIVFLIDVSGSMQDYNKLPLLKQSFRLLVNNLRKEDSVSIVVYAGAAGKVLDPTPGNEKEKIMDAIDNLSAGGSTAGAHGIELAYELAERSFIKGGNNRVILATDGDFNVGISDDSELVKLIENRREKGIFLTILGYGMGNYKDAKMEKLADKGNGSFAYIDNLLEAKKVLVNQLAGTLFTIAKDVKIQVEFNPAAVSGYRLIGYENRMLKKEDFNNDRKDAGDMGAGHTVTALYEIIPANAGFPPIVDELKYQKNEPVTELSTNEMATIKIRYKKPDGDSSSLVKTVVYSDSFKDFEKASSDTRFAVTVAAAGMLLKNSKETGSLKWGAVLDWAKRSKGSDDSGYRAEFINMVEKSELISTVK